MMASRLSICLSFLLDISYFLKFKQQTFISHQGRQAQPLTFGTSAPRDRALELKYLLKFGQVTAYLGYSALQDFFPTMRLKPNPGCDDRYCRQRQIEVAQRPKPPPEKIEQKEEGPLHSDNEWGISLVDESVPSEPATSSGGDSQISMPGVGALAEGITVAYTLPQEPELPSTANPELEELSLDELMAQMKKI